jgi:hypothetical protein
VRIFNRATGKWRVLQVDFTLPCGIRDNKCACARDATRSLLRGLHTRRTCARL